MPDTLNTPDINGLSMRPTTELVALYNYCTSMILRADVEMISYIEKRTQIEQILDKRLGI